LINGYSKICQCSFFIHPKFIFFEADLGISQFSPYRVILYHSIASRSSKENEPKERAQAVQRIGQFFRYRVKSFTRLLRTTHSFKGIFAEQNRNINSKLAPRFRQFLTNLNYYAVEKDLTYLLADPN